MATTSTHFLQPLRDTLGASWIAGGALAEVRAGTSRIDIELACHAWREAEKATGGSVSGEPLGLAVARRLAVGTYGLLEMAARTAPTLLETMQRFAEHHALVNDAAEVSVSVTRVALRLSYDLPKVCKPLPACYQEYLFCSWVLLARSLTGTALVPDQVDLPHPKHGGGEGLAPVLGDDIRWERPLASLTLPGQFADLPVRGFEPELAALVESHAREQAHRVRRHAPWSERVATLVAQFGCAVRFDRVARLVGVSERGLRRNLQAEGTSFSRVLDGVREKTARDRLCGSSQTLTEIAEVCGFSDLKSFHRAFRRWTGQTPAAFRRQATSNC